jgi:uncharacterized caspase-like protein
MAIRCVTILLLAAALHVLAGLSSVASASQTSEACQKHDAEVAAGKPARRVALSIGNNDPGAGVNNAANDSVLIATTLRGLGWDVTQISNVDRQAMLAALQGLGSKIGEFCPSDVVLFYFAGNGLEVNLVSYFGGTDSATDRLANPKSFADQVDALKTFVSSNDVVTAIESHRGAKFIVLDTCRDNPFQKKDGGANLEQFAVRRLPNNTFFAYASEPLDNAADYGPDNRNHGPYAWALSRKLTEISGSAEEVFRKVRQEVIELSEKPGAAFKQRPFVESSLQGQVYLGKTPELRTLVASPTAGVAQRKSEKRIALLVANGNYVSQDALPNPANDIEYVSSVLKGLGFEVYVQNNLIRLDFTETLRAFGVKALEADWVLVYFAGHGMEIGGRTYLLPTDVKLEKDVHADDEAITLDVILEKVELARGLGLVVLDACRNNPFEQDIERTGRRGQAARTGSGLARADVDNVGVLVAYSAKHGTTAEDGEGKMSPFALALVEEIQKPGVEVNMVFRRVRDRVLERTERRQEPFMYGSLPGREFYFNDAGVAKAAIVPGK